MNPVSQDNVIMVDTESEAAGKFASCDGIVLIDKPAGVTSFAVVDSIRRSLATRASGPVQSGRRRRPGPKCGHAGTLDPLATGLLLVLVGSGVRLSRYLIGLDKAYTAVVRFGIGTDSHDRDGRVTARQAVRADRDDLTAALAAWRGEVRQAPPVISALKRDGQPLYRRVRRGEVVAEPSPRKVCIERLELQTIRWGVPPTTADDAPEATAAADGLVYEATLAVTCSSGTYIRALARDLATELGTVGHVHALRRTRIGPFTVQAALPPARAHEPRALLAALRPLADALPHVTTFTIDAERAALLRHGGQPDSGWCGGAQLPRQCKFCDTSGRLVAVAGTDPETGSLRTQAVFGVRQPAGEEG